MRDGLPSSRAASAIPMPSESPWPSEPVDASSAGMNRTSGMALVHRAELAQRVQLSIGRIARTRAITAYSTGQACPLDRMKRSRSGHFGFAGS